MGIEDTKTYDYCKKRYGNDEDWPEILENLDEVYHTGAIGKFPYADCSLITAFDWSLSPQSEGYWSNLYFRKQND